MFDKTKKFFLGVALLASVLTFAPTPDPALAVNNNDPLGVNPGQESGLSDDDPRIIVGRIIQVALGLLGITAVVLIIYGGFMIMTSGGNDEKISKGKNILITSVIGLGIILAAYSITTFVLENLYTATTGNIYQ